MLNTRRRPRAAALALPFALFGLLATGQARADLFPSTATDVEARGACRADGQFVHMDQRSSHFKNKVNWTAGSLSCGITDRVALGAALNYTDGTFWHGKSAHVLGSARLLGDSQTASALTLKFGLGASGNSQESFRYRGSHIGLAARHLSPSGHRLEASLSHHEPRHDQSEQIWSLGYGYQLTKDWEAFAGASGHSDGKPLHEAGVRWNLNPAWQLAAKLDKARTPTGLGNSSVGRELAARWTPSRAWQFTGSIGHRPSSAADHSEHTSVGMQVRHDF